MKKITVLSILYIPVIFLLFLYSYTQVDLSLTLSKASLYQTIEKSFQYIGYFQRPLSTALYMGILLLLFLFYGIFLYASAKNKLSKKNIWIIIILSTIILTFAYNAFSYDLFNYIFDAKIVTHYHENPYQHKALDYPFDPMLSFMRWTHRVYPYGPICLVMTIPLSFIGFQFFLPTFFLFKLFTGLVFLGSVFVLGKILQKINPDTEVFNLVLFALNPLVLIESLLSAHNDIVTILFSFIAFWFLLEKKNIRSFLFLLLSIGIKFTTVFLLPVFFAIWFFNTKKKKINWQKVFLSSSFLMIIPIIVAATRTNFQPWYILFALPYAVLTGKKYYILFPVIILSFFSLLQYAPYLYYGNWDAPVPSLLFWLTVAGVVSSFAGVAGYYFSRGSKY